ncbi:hypothetical protein [Aminobacter niigataensis]|uniref:hypothetical protein n=1 Tax=Aminobacter niigataensis TaxID=83265 RepID=UPI0024CB3FD5|nr:hypothetical protein [Aminobacter niigataensis]CAI2936059.1 protein of unknown function [Aminobacter niigataensis]
MNRRDRRAGRWDKLTPHKDYDAMVAMVGEESQRLVMGVLRTLAGPEAHSTTGNSGTARASSSMLGC